MRDLLLATVKQITPSLTIRVDGSTVDIPVNINATGGLPQVGDRVAWMPLGVAERSPQVVIFAPARGIGEVMLYTVNVAPGPDWLRCDSGTAIARTDYPKLATLWGASPPYGAPDGAHMYLPPLHDGTGAYPRANSAMGNGGSYTHHHGSSQLVAQVGISTNGANAFFKFATSPSYTESQRMQGTSGSAGPGQTRGSSIVGNTDDSVTGDLPTWVGFTYWIKVR
jgi:hypothetical protein